jgi:UDP-perosamine 4-acetyltransferase
LKRPLIVLGAGGHAKVLIDALQQQSAEILGVTDRDAERKHQLMCGVPIIGNDEAVMAYPAERIYLVNAVGSVRTGSRRRELFERFNRLGYQFTSVIHPSAIMAADVVCAKGVQIMAGALVQVGSFIGENTVINTGAIVDHDCQIGAHVHISPGAVLCGGVQVGEGAHIGAGATVIQGIRIGKNSLVAAGAVVVRDVPDGMMVMGVPAKEKKQDSYVDREKGGNSR